IFTHGRYGVHVAAVYRNPRPSRGEQARDRGADAARTACDQSHFVFQVGHGAHLCSESLLEFRSRTRTSVSAKPGPEAQRLQPRGPACTPSVKSGFEAKKRALGVAARTPRRLAKSS